MGLDRRKPVFGGLRTTKAQASPFVISLYINLLLVKFQFSS